MKRMSFILTIAVALFAAPLVAQQTATTQGVAQQTATTQTSQPPPRPGTTAQQGLGSLASMDNVRLELVITDQTGAGQPLKKAVTMLLAERGTGRVRSGGQVYRAGTEDAPGSQYVPVTLNADANLTALQGDRVRVYITVEYQPAGSGALAANRVSQLNQTVDVILLSGKPTLIVESADPMSDRKVSLHATATIVR